MTSGPDSLDRPRSNLSPPQGEAKGRFEETRFAFLKYHLARDRLDLWGPEGQVQEGDYTDLSTDS